MLSVVFWSRKTFPSNATIKGAAALVELDVNHSFENRLLLRSIIVNAPEVEIAKHSRSRKGTGSF